jgi:hypothetical protein
LVHELSNPSHIPEHGLTMCFTVPTTPRSIGDRIGRLSKQNIAAPH